MVFRKTSEIYDPDRLSDSGQKSDSLSSQEIDFFLENGYLVKQALVDPEQAKHILNFAWDYLIRSVPIDSTSSRKLKAEDPSTWITPQWIPSGPPAKSGFYEGRQRIAYGGRSVKIHDIGDQKMLLDLLPNNPVVRGIAQKILGVNLRASERTRGIYAIFPGPRVSHDSKIDGSMLGPHTDRVCQQLNVCTYLDTVPPRGGGFTLYPGSHKIMYYAHENDSNWTPIQEFRAKIERVVNDITPIEIPGEPGDVIFWHGRTVHSIGIHVRENVRWAVFGDYMLDEPTLDEDIHRKLGQYEWYKDTRLLEHDLPTSENMWQKWRISP